MTTATEMLRTELIKTIQKQHLCQAADIRQAIQFMTSIVLVAFVLCAAPLVHASDLDQAEAQLKKSLAGEATVTRQDLPKFTEAQKDAIELARKQLAGLGE